MQRNRQIQFNLNGQLLSVLVLCIDALQHILHRIETCIDLVQIAFT